MAKIGRNEPCPCGSGKKYKHCCGRDSATIIPFPPARTSTPGNATDDPFNEQTFMERQGTPNMATDLLHQLKAELGDRTFSSKSELEAVFGAFVKKKRTTAIDDFLGLSPDMMHRILHGTFDDISDILELGGHILKTEVPLIPLLDIISALLGFLAESGPVPATAKGNLPRALIQRWWDEKLGPLEPNERLRAIMRPNNEMGAWTLHIARVIAGKAGLIKLHSQKFSVTVRGRALFEAGDLDAMYRSMFIAMAWGIDWNDGKRDYQRVHPFTQRSFAFNLHLLGAKARDWMQPSAIVEAYLKAFPVLRNDYQGEDARTTLIYMQSDLTYGLTRFPIELGLLEHRGGWGESKPDEYRVTPFFDRLLDWHI